MDDDEDVWMMMMMMMMMMMNKTRGIKKMGRSLEYMYLAFGKWGGGGGGRNEGVGVQYDIGIFVLAV